MKNKINKIFAGLVLVLLFTAFSGLATAMGNPMDNPSVDTGNGTGHEAGNGNGSASQGSGGMSTQIQEHVSEKVKEWHSNLGGTMHKFLTSEQTRNEIRQKVEQCRNNQSEDCKQLKQVGMYIAKGVLERAVNHTIDRLENAKTRIEQSNMSDEEKQVVTEKIDDTINKLNEIQQKLESAETPKEVREAIKEYRGIRKGLNLSLSLRLHVMRTKRIGLIVQRAEHLETKLQRFIARCPEKQDELQNLTGEFAAKIEEAKTLHQESSVIWQDLKEKLQTKNITRQEIPGYVKDAVEKTREAQGKLKEAQQSLKQIVHELRHCMKPITPNENESNNAGSQNETNETINTTNTTETPITGPVQEPVQEQTV